RLDLAQIDQILLGPRHAGLAFRERRADADLLEAGAGVRMEQRLLDLLTELLDFLRLPPQNPGERLLTRRTGEHARLEAFERRGGRPDVRPEDLAGEAEP